MMQVWFFDNNFAASMKELPLYVAELKDRSSVKDFRMKYFTKN